MGTLRKLTSTLAALPSTPAVLFLHLPLNRGELTARWRTRRAEGREEFAFLGGLKEITPGYWGWGCSVIAKADLPATGFPTAHWHASPSGLLLLCPQLCFFPLFVPCPHPAFSSSL